MRAFVMRRLPWQSPTQGHGLAESMREETLPSDARSLIGIANLQAPVQPAGAIHEFGFATGATSLEDQVVLHRPAKRSSDLA
jgi:hypothetical protein